MNIGMLKIGGEVIGAGGANSRRVETRTGIVSVILGGVIIPSTGAGRSTVSQSPT